MTATTNAENLQQYSSRFSLIAKQVLAFGSHHNMVRELKKFPPNFKQIVLRCLTLLNIFIWIVRSILSLNSEQFHQNY